MELKGKRVLVIGGSSGIGLGAARAATSRGAEVVIAGRSAKRLEEAVGLLGRGATVSVRPLDVTDEADVTTFFARESRFDHVLVTAAYAYVKPLAELPLEEVRRVLEAKVVAAMNVAKHARLEVGGSLTLTAGINQARPLRGVSAVAAANGALVALGRALAVELAPVRVNVLSPGWVDTPIWAAFGERREAMLAGQAQKLPVGKVGSIDELGHAAVFLMENDFTTGTVLEVDGGHRLV